MPACSCGYAIWLGHGATADSERVSGGHHHPILGVGLSNCRNIELVVTCVACSFCVADANKAGKSCGEFDAAYITGVEHEQPSGLRELMRRWPRLPLLDSLAGGA